MRAIFGLGNPGKKYKDTRHNIGFIILDHLSELYSVPFKAGKGDYYFAEISCHNERVLLVKPTTYMNRSGEAVGHVLRYFPVTREELLIVYDDYNLPLGTIRFRPQGTDGGHNGISSIIYELNSDVFDRLRFGIGTEFRDAVRHVLSGFSRQEQNELTNLVQISGRGIEYWIANGIEDTMNNFNRSYLDENSN